MLPGGVGVASMSWPSMTVGWALSDRSDGTRQLLETSDAGATWVPKSAVDGNGATQVVFADTNNGWLVGAHGLVSTHDGGATWTTVTVAGGITTAAAIAAADGSVHIAYLDNQPTNLGVHIASSPIDRDQFVATSVAIPVGAGPRLTVSMSAGGPHGEMIYDDRTLIGAAEIRDGQWATWDLACPYANPTATAGLSPNGQALAIACSPSGFGDDAPIVGANLSTGALAWSTIEPAGNQADGQASAAFATATDTGVRVIAYTTADGQGQIASSTDAGATWPTRTPLPAGTTPSAIDHLPNGGLIVAILPSGGLTSTDALTWTPVKTS